MEKKELVRKVISHELLGVIATVSSDGMKPEAALVAVTETDDLEIVFGTRNTTQKYKNIQKNPNVSFVIGTSSEQKITVQYAGLARELADKELDTYQRLHIKKHPGSKKFVFSPEERMFIASPVWIRYSDYKSEPPVIFELEAF
ncbi:MAG: pyridoxamine 5'-phosphate oxidase family protein [Candidatus Andersenbacteria bacterium]